MSNLSRLLRLYCCAAALAPIACDIPFDLRGLAVPGERLAVNPSLRTACGDPGGRLSMPDHVIAALIFEVEQYRQSGVSKADLLQAEVNTCLGGCQQACDASPALCGGESPLDCVSFCVSCMGAIVDQVFEP